MVGDSDVDIQTARNAGMVAVGVTYGFGKHDAVLEPADVYIDSLSAAERPDERLRVLTALVDSPCVPLLVFGRLTAC